MELVQLDRLGWLKALHLAQALQRNPVASMTLNHPLSNSI